MADGRVEIDTRLETGNIRQDVQRVNGELNRIGDGVADATRGLTDEVGARYDSLGRRIQYVYRGTSEEARRMYSEMASAHRQQSLAMHEFKDQLLSVEYGYFQLAQASENFTGTTEEFIAQVQELGAAQKAANDAMINGNRLAMISMLQTVGTMLNMTTQAQRISDNYTRMANPLYNINRAGLAAANSLNQLANRGNAAVLALKMLGPTASMKDLLNMQMMITQGLMRFQMVALAAAATSALLYGSLHKANMEMNPQYAEAYNNMIEKLTKALQPMRDAFAAVMIPIYNFVSAMADLIIKFNEAHPVLARFIQGTIMLIPLLTLILSPLAIGIGLWNGMLAAWNSIWMVIGPLITGLAAMSATVWVVAAAIVGLTMGLVHLWKTSEGFRNSVTNIISSIKEFGRALADLGEYLFYVLMTGDAFDDVISKLPPSVQWLAKVLDNVMVALHDFGQALVNLSKYLFAVIEDGDYLNDWITHLPESFQGAAQKIGEAVNKIREGVLTLVNAIKSAFNGDFSGLLEIFQTLIPSMIAMIVGGIPGLVLSIGTMFVRMSEGMGQGGTTLLTKFTEIMNSIVQGLMTFVSTQLPVFIEQGMKIITGLIQGIVTAIPQIVTAITQIITVFVQGFALLLPQIIQIGINLITTLIQGITQMLPALVAGALQIVTALVQGITQMLPLIIQSGIQIITTLIQTIIPLIPQLIQSGIQILMALVNGIIQVIPSIIDAAIMIMQQLLTTIVENLPLIIDAGIKVLNALINGIIQVLPQIIDAVLQIVTKFTEAIVQNLPEIIDSGIKILEKLIEGIIQILPQIVDAVIKIITKFTEVIVQNLPQIIDAGIQILTKLIEGIIKVLPQLVSAGIKLMGELLKAIIQHLPELLSAGVELIGALIEGIISLLGEVFSSGVEIGGELLDSLGDIDLFEIGANIIEGLIDGIGSMASAAWEEAKSVASGIKDAVTGFLDIHSPSRVMRDMGIYVGQGLVKGIGTMGNPVYNAAEKMAVMVQDAFNSLSEGVELGNVSMGTLTASSINKPRDKNSILGKIEEMFDLNTMPDIQMMTNVSNSMINKNPPRYERDNRNNSISSSSTENNAPTYLVMDKKIVGELLAGDIKDINERNAMRLSQF